MTFICGRAGVCALGAVAAKHANDEALQSYYLSQLGEVAFLVFTLFCVIFHIFVKNKLVVGEYLLIVYETD